MQFDWFLSVLEQKWLENHEIYYIGAAELPLRFTNCAPLLGWRYLYWHQEPLRQAWGNNVTEDINFNVTLFQPQIEQNFIRFWYIIDCTTQKTFFWSPQNYDHLFWSQKFCKIVALKMINLWTIEQHNMFRILFFLFSSSAIKAVTNVHNKRFERQASVT